MPDYDDGLVDAVLESQRKTIEAYKPLDVTATETGRAILARAAIAAVLEWQGLTSGRTVLIDEDRYHELVVDSIRDDRE